MSDSTVGSKDPEGQNYIRRSHDNGRIHKITNSPYAKVWGSFNSSIVLPGLIGLTAYFGNLILQDILEAIDIGNKNDVQMLSEIVELRAQDTVQIQQLGWLVVRQDGLVLRTNRLESTVDYLKGVYANSVGPRQNR